MSITVNVQDIDYAEARPFPDLGFATVNVITKGGGCALFFDKYDDARDVAAAINKAVGADDA